MTLMVRLSEITKPLRQHLLNEGETLVFAMNGGMYHDDRSPVGLYIDGEGQRARLNRNEGPGNFHLLPNGVFVLDGTDALVLESGAFADLYEREDLPDYASQSGPMLVIDGDIHPEINADGTSRKRRNGVGVSADGRTVFFVISDIPVTFHEFASLFRDELGAPNALYLDGVVSRLYASDIGRDEKGLDMGPNRRRCENKTMMKLYGLKNCDTCKKALKALEGCGKARGTGRHPGPTQIWRKKFQPWLDSAGADLLVNRRSTTWRGLSEAERESDPQALLIANPTLIKRPVIETDNAVHVGWTKDVQAELL